VCDVVSGTLFAISATQQVAGHIAGNKMIRARNKAKLANFKLANQQYMANVVTENAKWKNQVSDADIAIDNIFTAAQGRLQAQDLELEGLVAGHVWNKNELIRDMYKNEYAGEQTGVTASRLASEDIRKTGLALTKSLADVMLNQDKAWVNKEIIRNDADMNRRSQWREVWRSPVHGAAPRAPELERTKGAGGLLVRLAVSAAIAYAGHKAGKAFGGSKGGKDGAKGLLEGNAKASELLSQTTGSGTGGALGVTFTKAGSTAVTQGGTLATNFAAGGIPNVTKVVDPNLIKLGSDSLTIVPPEPWVSTIMNQPNPWLDAASFGQPMDFLRSSSSNFWADNAQVFKTLQLQDAVQGGIFTPKDDYDTTQLYAPTFSPSITN